MVSSDELLAILKAGDSSISPICSAEAVAAVGDVLTPSVLPSLLLSPGKALRGTPLERKDHPHHEAMLGLLSCAVASMVTRAVIVFPRHSDRFGQFATVVTQGGDGMSVLRFDDGDVLLYPNTAFAVQPPGGAADQKTPAELMTPMAQEVNLALCGFNPPPDTLPSPHEEVLVNLAAWRTADIINAGGGDITEAFLQLPSKLSRDSHEFKLLQGTHAHNAYFRRVLKHMLKVKKNKGKGELHRERGAKRLLHGYGSDGSSEDSSDGVDSGEEGRAKRHKVISEDGEEDEYDVAVSPPPERESPSPPVLIEVITGGPSEDSALRAAAAAGVLTVAVSATPVESDSDDSGDSEDAHAAVGAVMEREAALHEVGKEVAGERPTTPPGPVARRVLRLARRVARMGPTAEEVSDHPFAHAGDKAHAYYRFVRERERRVWEMMHPPKPEETPGGPEDVVQEGKGDEGCEAEVTSAVEQRESTPVHEATRMPQDIRQSLRELAVELEGNAGGEVEGDLPPSPPRPLSPASRLRNIVQKVGRRGDSPVTRRKQRHFRRKGRSSSGSSTSCQGSASSSAP